MFFKYNLRQRVRKTLVTEANYSRNKPELILGAESSRSRQESLILHVVFYKEQESFLGAPAPSTLYRAELLLPAVARLYRVTSTNLEKPLGRIRAAAYRKQIGRASCRERV